MKQMNVLVFALAAALAPAPVVAQNTANTPSGAKQRIQLDANRDGAIDRAEAAKAPKLAQKFDRLDKNRDGKLSADERPMRGDGMRHKRGGHAGWMQRADTDKDGRISRAEAQATQAKAGERFERIDVNQDGYIDRQDQQARVAVRRGECFGKADTDRNGQLSRAEFDKMGEVCR